MNYHPAVDLVHASLKTLELMQVRGQQPSRQVYKARVNRSPFAAASDLRPVISSQLMITKPSQMSLLLIQLM